MEAMPDPGAIHLRITGRVQGVGYRFFVKETADRLELVGWVRNHSDGNVEAVGEGPRALLEEWLDQLKKGPPMSRVDQIQVDWQTPAKTEKHFTILTSGY